MLTSESTAIEFRRFFNKYKEDCALRLGGLINKKYRRALIPIVKRGEDIPHIFGTLKLDEITLYSLALDVEFVNKEALLHFGCFLIMKDLHKQSRIMVIETPPSETFSIVYSAHAISRYKERIGLADEMDFIDVCKHMFAVGGCGSPGITTNYPEVYGTNPDNRTASFICQNGVFMGYYSMERDMYYAETFLTSKDLRGDQAYLDPEKDPDNRRMLERIKRGRKIKAAPLEPDRLSGHHLIDVVDGKAKILSRTEINEQIEEQLRKQAENPNYFQDQAQANRPIAERRLRRKGYK